MYFRALGSLYGDPNWSKGGIDKSMESVKKELSKNVLSMFSSEQLQEYKQRMEEREKKGFLVSLIDMWGLALEYLFQGKVEKKKSFLSVLALYPNFIHDILLSFYRNTWVLYLKCREQCLRARTLYPYSQLLI